VVRNDCRAFAWRAAAGISAASAHHPGIGGAGGIFTAGTLDEGQFAFSTFVDYLRLKQLSEPTLLANIGNDDQRTSGPLRAQ
jgi:hypothetical protein